MEISISLAILAIIAYWVYKRSSNGKDTLEYQGIAHEKPLPFFGNILPLLLMKEGAVNYFERMYTKFYGEK